VIRYPDRPTPVPAPTLINTPVKFFSLSFSNIFFRSKEKEDRKEEILALERERIKNKVFELELKLEKQTTQIRELARNEGTTLLEFLIFFATI
jgi:hypothetical protein